MDVRGTDETVDTTLRRTRELSNTDSGRTATTSSTTTVRSAARRNPYKRPKRLRRFCFTLNNPTDMEKEDIRKRAEGRDLGRKIPMVRYLIYQQERGTTGTLHLQGYCELKSQFSLPTIKKWKGFKRMHIESSRGTQRECIDYCRKEDTRVEGTEPVEFGEPCKHGLTGNMADDLLDTTIPKKELINAYPTQCMHLGSKIDYIRGTIMGGRNWGMEIVIFYGPTGSGKSWLANKEWQDAYHVKWPEKNGVFWWDKYDGEETVICNEFRHQVPYCFMLTLLDRYRMKIQVKGGMTEFRSRRIVFTTNIPPKDWYPNVRDRAPLIRRINQYATITRFGPMRNWDGINEPTRDNLDMTVEEDEIPLPEEQDTLAGGWQATGGRRHTAIDNVDPEFNFNVNRDDDPPISELLGLSSSSIVQMNNN